MSRPDRLIAKYVKLVSGLDPAEQRAVLAIMPRDGKAALEGQLVKRLRGEEAARRAEEDFDLKFRRDEIPGEIDERTVSNPQDLVAELVEIGLRESRGDSRRLIEQCGVRINGEKAAPDAVLKDGDVLQAGKRSF